MKKFLHICFLAASLITVTGVNAQKVYNITKSGQYSDTKLPTHCYDCTITFAKGVVITLDSDVQWQNATITGGTIIAEKSFVMKLWTVVNLNDIIFDFQSKSLLESSATLTVKNSQFNFYNSASMTNNSLADFTNTKLRFLDNSSLLANSGNFNLREASVLVVGDGTVGSKAYAKFNGGTLNEYGTASNVTLANYNNYYFNWSNYNGNGKSYKTTDNKLNCGTAGKNSCSSAIVYGPATLNFAGIASSAVLPVKLIAFSVKLTGSKVDVAWTTSQEINSSRFEIERSTDGLSWKSVGSVNAKVNSTITVQYAFTDASLVSGTVSYRLKMIDQDETFEYSPIRSVKVAATGNAHQMSVYPNPATDFVVISTANGSEKVQIQLISQNGQMLKQISGNGKVSMQVSEFKTGNYIVRVADSAGTAQSFKLMITK